MKGIVVDVETNGLMDFKRSADAEGQPRMAHFAMILIDDGGNVEGENNFFIAPDGWSMTPETTAINGLTDEYLTLHGVPVKIALDCYSTAIMEGRMVISHGAQFDLKIMRSELRRAGMDDLFEQTPNVCTMRKANGIILCERTDKKTGEKKLVGGWPSLNRCRDVLGISTEGAHGAVKDAMDALAVYKHLLAQGVDLTPEVHHHADVESIRRAS